MYTPKPLGLVAGGEHDPAADDHGAVAQPWIVALLDRGVERVEVGVQDRRRSVIVQRRIEHMFAEEAASGTDPVILSEVTTPTRAADGALPTRPESDTELAHRASPGRGRHLLWIAAAT